MSLVMTCWLLAAAPAPGVLTLAEAQSFARSQAFDVRIARERLLRAQALARKSWAQILPILSAVGSVSTSDGPSLDPTGSSGGVTNGSWQAGLRMTWTLFDARSIPRIQRAYGEAELSAIGSREIEEALVYGVSRAYYNALTAARQVEIRERALTIARANLTLSQARAEVGQSTRLDVVRADTEVAGAQQALVQASNAYELSRRALAVLIDWIEADGSMRPFALERPPAPPTAPADALGEALEQRLDLRAREIDLELAQHDRRETWLRLAPVLSADGQVGLRDDSGDAATWRLSLTLTWTLFEGFANVFELSEREHAQNVAALGIDRTRKQVADEVAEARINLDSALAAHAAARRRAELARESAQLVQAQFQVGTATQLEVLDAIRSLSDAETAEALGELDVDVAALTLDAVVRVPANGPQG